LYFYPKDDTPGSTIEAINFQQLGTDFAALWVQVLGVSKDSAKSHCSFVAKHDLEFPLIVDSDLVLHAKFSTIGEKKMFGKTYQWTMRSTFVLQSDGAIVKERRNVTAKGHAQLVYDYCTTL
jgi:peroxiredoxin Q/BCP